MPPGLQTLSCLVGSYSRQLVLSMLPDTRLLDKGVKWHCFNNVNG